MMSQVKLFSLLATLLFFLALGALAQQGTRGAQVVFAAEPTQPYVTTRDVNLRSGPGTQYKIITEIKEGTKVNVAGREGEWLRVVSKSGKPPGYIQEKYARPVEERSKQTTSFAPGFYMTTADTSVREGPGLHYKVVAQIPKDTKVYVVGGEGDWYRVQSKHGRAPGYIDRRYAQRRADR